MKKQLAIAAGLAVLSTGAYASKARMQALGQGDASLYLDDTRSMFINPAKVNTTKNFVLTEWGAENASGTTARLEGGMIRESGAFTYGFYFNNENNDQDQIANGTALTTVPNGKNLGTVGEAGFVNATNGLDVFFGGDMGVQWGARLHYSGSMDNSGGSAPYDMEHSAMGLGLGMMMGDIEAYANMDLTNEYTGTTGSKDDKWEGGAMNLGLSYAMGGWTFFGDYDKKDGEYTNNNTGTADPVDKYEMSTISIGAAHVTEVSSTARIISDVRYATTTTKTEIETTGTTVTLEEKYGRLPVTVAFEADANSWLTLRGYVGQNILINKAEYTDSSDNDNNDENSVASTMFGAGATLNFGKLKVDGMIGNGATSDQLNTDTLLSKVAVHYWF